MLKVIFNSVFFAAVVQICCHLVYIKTMANTNERLQAAQAYVAQNPNCCLLDLNQFELELDDLAELRGDCEPIECGDGFCPYAPVDE